MQREEEDRFVVFVRTGRDPERPEISERPFTTCPTYADAQRIRRGLHLINRDCVIRYEGETGGGD
jgi:hypothetical protein